MIMMSAAWSRLRFRMAVVACLLCAPVVASAAEVNARLDRNTIYLGTQTLLVIEVEEDAG